MCPPSAKTHESIVTLITPSREFTISEDFSRFARVPNVSPPQRSISSRQAEGLCRRALEGRESQLGPQHPSTLVSAAQLGQSLVQTGQVGGGWAEVFGVQRGGLPGTVEGKAFLMWPGRGRDG